MDIKFKTTNDEIVNINDSVLKYKDTKGEVHKYNISDIENVSLVNGLLNIKYSNQEEHDFILKKSDFQKVKPFVNKLNGIEDIVDPTTSKNKLVLLSGIMTIAYLLFSIYAYSNPAPAPINEFEAIGYEIGTSIGYAIIMPHYVLVVVAIVFNALGYFMNKRAFVLTSAILYAVSMAALPINALFILIQMILMFIAFSKMPKQNQ